MEDSQRPAEGSRGSGHGPEDHAPENEPGSSTYEESEGVEVRGSDSVQYQLCEGEKRNDISICQRSVPLYDPRLVTLSCTAFSLTQTIKKQKGPKCALGFCYFSFIFIFPMPFLCIIFLLIDILLYCLCCRSS